MTEKNFALCVRFFFRPDAVWARNGGEMGPWIVQFLGGLGGLER